MDEQFLSPIEVAEILQVKKNTVYEMIKRGDLKATKMGKQFRIARNDLYEYMGISRKQSLRKILSSVDRISFWMCFALFIMNRVTENAGVPVSDGQLQRIVPDVSE